MANRITGLNANRERCGLIVSCVINAATRRTYSVGKIAMAKDADVSEVPSGPQYVEGWLDSYERQLWGELGPIPNDRTGRDLFRIANAFLEAVGSKHRVGDDDSRDGQVFVRRWNAAIKDGKPVELALESAMRPILDDMLDA